MIKDGGIKTINIEDGAITDAKITSVSTGKISGCSEDETLLFDAQGDAICTAKNLIGLQEVITQEDASGTNISGVSGNGTAATPLSVDFSKVQKKIGTPCNAGEFARGINEDGSIDCQTESDTSDTNEIQGVISGGGIIVDGENKFALKSCGTNQVLKSNGSGAWSCYTQAKYEEKDPRVSSLHLDSLKISANGNVGIGKTPGTGKKLDVNGHAQFAGKITSASTVSGDDTLTLTTKGYVDGINTDNQELSLTGNTVHLTNGGNIDLSPYLDNTDTQLSEAQVDDFVSNNGYLTSYTETDPAIGILNLNTLNISADGRVGIGKTPGTGKKLDVLGDAQFSGRINANGGIDGLTLANGISGSNYNIEGVNEVVILDSGEGIRFDEQGQRKGLISMVDDDINHDKMQILAEEIGIGKIPTDGIKLDVNGHAQFSGKVTSASTVIGDTAATLTTKGYVDTKIVEGNTQLSEAQVDEFVSNNGYLTSYTETDPTFTTNNFDKININANGNIGVGTQDPSYLLDLLSESPSIRIQDSDAGVVNLIGADNSGGFTFINSNHPYRILTNGEERMRVTANGNIGIGTRTPLSKLHITGGEKNEIIVGGMSQDANLRFAAIGNDKNSDTIYLKHYLNTGLLDEGGININKDGNIGIGTKTPSEILEVNGNIKTQGLILETLAADPASPIEGQMWIVQ